MKNNKNKVQIFGVIMGIQPGTFFKDGEKFVRFYIGVKRTSGNVDLLPVIVEEEYMGGLKVGHRVYIEGKYISFNKHENGKSRLILEIQPEVFGKTDEENDENKIVLEGYLCKPPVYRKTPMGKEICDLIIACNDNEKTDYIPCICWFKNARMASGFKVGDYVKFLGRIQSRIYQKELPGGEVEFRTAYEISIGRIMGNEESGSKKDHA